jgi:hypothetical protein
MLWGYFCKHSDPRRLQAMRNELEVDGYQYVDACDSEDGTSWLQVSKAEQLTADELHHRCGKLNELANRCGVEFDGFDVGHVDGDILYPSESGDLIG